MAIGGPESPQDMLRHDIGAPELDPTQQAMSSVEQASGQPTTSTPTSSVSRQRTPFSLTDAQYIPTTQELFPGNDVSMGRTTRTTQVGKYGGAPIFQAGLANSMPVVAAIGGKLRSIANERERLKQQGEKLDLYGDFEKVDRPEYEPALNRWQVQKVDGIVRGAQEFYAGDNIKARAALADPMNPWGRRLRAETEAVNSVVRLGNDVFKEAASTVAGMDDGTVLFNKKEYDRANGILHAMEDPQADVRNISKDIKRWRATKDVAKYIKDQGVVDDILKQANIDITDPRYQRDPKTGRIYATQEQVKNFETVARDAAKGIQDRYKRQGIDIPMEDIMGYLPAPIQRDVKVVDTTWPPSASGGGSDGVNANNRVVLARGNRPFFDNSRSNITQRGGTKGIESEVVDIATQSGKQLGVLTFSDPDNDGAPVKMTPLYIQRDPVHPTQFFIVGNSATGSRTETITNADGTTTTVTVEDGGGIKDSGTDKSGSTTTDTNKQPTFTRVRVNGNENLLERVLQGQDWRSMFGGRKESQPFIEPTKAQDNSPLSAFPDAKQESDGTWYVVRNGKKKYLTQQ